MSFDPTPRVMVDLVAVASASITALLVASSGAITLLISVVLLPFPQLLLSL